jgi:hypothetical protein
MTVILGLRTLNENGAVFGRFQPSILMNADGSNQLKIVNSFATYREKEKTVDVRRLVSPKTFEIVREWFQVDLSMFDLSIRHFDYTDSSQLNIYFCKRNMNRNFNVTYIDGQMSNNVETIETVKKNRDIERFVFQRCFESRIAESTIKTGLLPSNLALVTSQKNRNFNLPSVIKFRFKSKKCLRLEAICPVYEVLGRERAHEV